jgi:hypothetical protein
MCDKAADEVFRLETIDLEQLRTMAIVPRDAQTISEAENIINDKETGILNKPITNKLFEITATISGKSLNEMTNEKLTKKAVSPRLQAKAIANVDVLFERAVIHISHPDTHKRKNVEQVHRLVFCNKLLTKCKNVIY